MKDPAEIVSATQYGNISLCKKIVEEYGYDVKTTDQSGISLLHWAAINNRQDLISYYIQKGAVVDAKGGDLQGTPLHWAVRQGIFPAVKLLISYGADPLLEDNEGISAIHMAVQCNHIIICAYLLAKGVDVNIRDLDGRTPLMWASLRIHGFDMIRMLISFGAEVNLICRLKNQTALHYAAETENAFAVELLLQAGTNPLLINHDNKTALQMIYSDELSSKMFREILKEHSRDMGYFQESFILPHHFMNPKLQTIVTMVVLMAVFGVIFQTNFMWYTKLCLIIFLSILCGLSFRPIARIRLESSIPIGIYISLKLWMHFYFFTTLAEYALIPKNFLWCILASTLEAFTHYKAMTIDPGFVSQASHQQKIQTITNCLDLGQFEFSNICLTCLTRKPLRSKHCKTCNRCVARFDHHCPWVSNCVGFLNHHWFMYYLLAEVMLVTVFLKGTVWYHHSSHCAPFINHGSYGFFNHIYELSQCDANITYWYIIGIGVFAAVLSLFFHHFLFNCIYEVTTNEIICKLKRRYFGADKAFSITSDFSKGYWQNTVNLFRWNCMSCLCQPSDIDWRAVFDDHELISVTAIHNE